MRVYVPTTGTGLRALQQAGALATADGPLTAFAVTPGLREWYGADPAAAGSADGSADSSADDEELEYAALSEAGRASLRLLDADPSAARRRVVVAADVPDSAVEIRDDLDRGVVRLGDAIPLSAIASLHVDDAEAEETIAAAADTIVSADLGDEESIAAVDDADGFELSWYANQELAAVLAEL